VANIWLDEVEENHFYVPALIIADIVELGGRLATPSCHSEPFALCHSEGEKGPKNLTQDKLREESRPFAIAQGDKRNALRVSSFGTG